MGEPDGRTTAALATAVGRAVAVLGAATRTLAGPTHAALARVRGTGTRWARHRAARAGGRLCGLLAVSAIGIALGVLLGGRVSQDVGPFHAEFAVKPALSGGAEVIIPPLGSLHLRTHAGPAHLVIRLGALDQVRTRAVVTDPNGVARASETAADDVARGVRRLALQVGGVGLLGGMLLGAMVYRSMRRVAQCGGLSLAILAGSGVLAVATFRTDAIEEPRYEGLLTNAPAVVGDARRIAGRYEAYQAELQRLVSNVGRIYSTISSLPVYEPDSGTTRVLHISDVHLNPTAWSVVQTVVQQFNIDLVVDTGDITDWGSEPEAGFLGAIAGLRVPYVYVRGNHDSALTAASVARQPNAIVLDNSVVMVSGLTVAGIGDPRFTPDKTTDAGDDGDAAEAAHRIVEAAGGHLADTIRSYGTQVDLAVLHDPASAPGLAGACPLVLAGHLHKREVRRLDPAPADGSPLKERTLLMVEGSTGGAGLRGLDNEEPLPLELSVLYFDRSHALQAYDDITVGGTGQTEVTLQRHVVKPDDKVPASPSPVSSSPESSSLLPSSPLPSTS
jgi:predicted MPP superfamily phosphohydrolase